MALRNEGLKACQKKRTREIKEGGWGGREKEEGKKDKKLLSAESPSREITPKEKKVDGTCEALSGPSWPVLFHSSTKVQSTPVVHSGWRLRALLRCAW
jgi:hypothetical protein